MFLWLPLTNFHPVHGGDRNNHTFPLILGKSTFCSFVSNTPNGTTPRSPPGVLFPFLFRLKSPTHLKVFYRFPLLQDEEGGRVQARRRRVPPFQNSHRLRRRRSFSGGWGRQEGGQQMDGAGSGGRGVLGGGLSQLFWGSRLWSA